MESQRGEAARSATARRILAAAEARYRFYGFRKTTMADIADDLDMSAANLYRYFDNKQALAAEVVRSLLERRLAAVERAVQQAADETGPRLHAFTAELLAQTHSVCVEQPRVSELVDIITEGHRQIVHSHNAAEQALIARILERDPRPGVRRNATGLSKQIHSALSMFRAPVFMAYYPRAELQRRAAQVTDLILRGLGEHAERQ